MKTIRGKFFMAFIGLVFIIYFVFWFGMEFFVDTYYYHQKITTMQNTINQIEIILKVNDSPLERLQSIEYLGYYFEGKINVYDVEAGIVVSDDDIAEFSKGKIIKNFYVDEAKAYILETDYPVTGSRWLVYGEVLSTNGLAVLQIPLTAIDQTVETMNVFMTYMGLVGIIIAMIIAGIVSTNMTRPIKKLTLMAEEIRQLKFNVRYNDDRQDEIGQLGETFNALTERLDSTIKALKYELSKEKQLDVLRKEFVAQVSHELQTPLSVIQGYIEALEDGVADSKEEVQEYHMIIFDESKKMSRMIKDILKLSELEAGTFTVVKEFIDLQEFFDHINQDYQTLLSHQNNRLIYKSLNEVIYFEGDRVKLEQAIRNILNNAIKYANEGSSIHYTAVYKDRWVTVTISNDGPNIDEEEIIKIFDSFYKGTNSSEKEGTGIGLAVVAKVFEYHKVTYYIQNTKNGVAFIIKMPIV